MRESSETKSANLSTKIEPLSGAIDARFLRCGKANCKCAKGDLHGPYYVRRWREYGKRYSKYVKKSDVSATFQAVFEYRKSRQETREMVRSINEAGNTLLRAMREMLRGYRL